MRYYSILFPIQKLGERDARGRELFLENGILSPSEIKSARYKMLFDFFSFIGISGGGSILLKHPIK